MKHAFIMDPLEKVKAYKDTTYYLMLAARERGHEIYYLDQRDLYLDHDCLSAKLTLVDVHASHEQPFSIMDESSTPLADLDVIWIRTDPPLDRRYFYMTLFLDFLPPSVRVVNQPSGVRNWNEKLAALCYPDLTPRTLVSHDAAQIKSFVSGQRRTTLKPIDGHGGQGIYFATPGEAELDTLLRDITRDGREWIIAQEYLPAAADGDKRILLLDGEPLGGILRVHADGVELNNMDAGGTANPIDLTQCDLEICKRIKPGLIEQGIYFAGIDVIGGMLIEINVTSPTGLQELCRFSGEAFHHTIIERLE